MGFTAVYELMNCKSKGTHIFMGQYTLFDNDKLLELLIDILARKMKFVQLRDEEIFDPDYLESLANEQPMSGS